MSKVSNWDRVVMKAWLERSERDSPRRHPPKADRIYKRFAANIERVERYLTAERMVDRYRHSSYTAYERASDHACSYSHTDHDYAWKYQYWVDVANIIKEIER